ncbi:MAG: glycosyltransferase family 2 protein [Armatimonadota bacterium]|nr:glycosyltransferase family 2 protein [bacterium]MDW8321961.1 glycosyltransferase family 2 protein [Armatimonadota bacterium]
MRVTAIIPAYNEETRLPRVLEAVRAASLVDEIVVVSDGSADRTYEVARNFDGVHALQLPQNLGKGGAMHVGACFTDSPVIVFLDADLIGLTPEHVDRLVEPVRCGDADMTLGVFRGGRRATDLAQKLFPFVSGQRAIRRELFLEVPNVQFARFGVETQITRWAMRQRWRVRYVLLFGVTHPMKEEKLGRLRGTVARLRMYADIARILLDGRAPTRATRRLFRIRNK